MAVNPEEKVGGCVACKENDLHDKQDAAAALVEIGHCIVNRDIAFCGHVGGDRSNDTELVCVKISVKFSNLIIVASPVRSIKFIERDWIVDIDLFAGAYDDLSVTVDDPDYCILKVCNG